MAMRIAIWCLTTIVGWAKRSVPTKPSRFLEWWARRKERLCPPYAIRQILHRQCQLHQVLGDNDPAGKILFHVLGPVVVGNIRIAAGHEMAEHQHLHAGGLSDAADVFSRGLALPQMFLQRRAVFGLE